LTFDSVISIINWISFSKYTGFTYMDSDDDLY